MLGKVDSQQPRSILEILMQKPIHSVTQHGKECLIIIKELHR